MSSTSWKASSKGVPPLTMGSASPSARPTSERLEELPPPKKWLMRPSILPGPTNPSRKPAIPRASTEEVLRRLKSRVSVLCVRREALTLLNPRGGAREGGRDLSFRYRLCFVYLLAKMRRWWWSQYQMHWQLDCPETALSSRGQNRNWFPWE